MSPVEIVPFADDHLGEAGALLAARHRSHREAEPLLAARYEQEEFAREELERVWRTDGSSGAAAIRRGRLTGYLVGAPRTNPVWGDNVWIEAPGHAVQEPEVVRDLYALAAARWVEEGRCRHSVMVPSSDRSLLDSWWRLCFGQQHAYGVREVPAETEVVVPEGVQIRAPDPAEIEDLIEIDRVLPEHQRSSPVFSGVPPFDREESREEWLATLAGDDEEILIGAIGGRAVACWALVPVERSSEHRGLLAPERACLLGFAATLPDSRGHGVGVALTQAALAWAAGAGYETMVTDWRMTNLLSSRFWPRRGFQSTFFRMYRSIP